MRLLDILAVIQKTSAVSKNLNLVILIIIVMIVIILGSIFFKRK